MKKALIRVISPGVFIMLYILFSIAFHTTPALAQDTTSDQVATSLDISVISSSGKSTSTLRDASYSSAVSFSADDTITITSTEAMYGVYIIWGANTDPWTLTYNGQSKTYGENGYLHEYVEIPDGTTSCTITLTNSESICDIYAYSSGSLPDDVQVWNAPCDQADILVFSTHADDEILFLGGVLATYAGEDNLKVQVVYMTNYWNGAKIREHEKLDGLWESGVRNYPINGSFDDLYSTTLDGALSVYDYSSVLSFVTEQIRRFQPLVCVTQDINGEYGHGGHMLLAKAVQESVNSSMDASFCADSAVKYGTWNVPKTYLHLYPENTIQLNLRVPLLNMGNRTAIEVASDAYKKHVSQQWCWFYVSDDYQYSCANFGLYRTTVGTDTSNDMLENVTTYEEQAVLAAKQAQEESIAASEAESLSIAQEEASFAASIESEAQTKRLKNITVFVIIFILLILAFVVWICVRKKHKPL